MTQHFGFVVPLRNKSTASDWDTTVNLCIDTLKSICRYKTFPCEVILVCKEFPDVDRPDNITIIRSDFADPNPNWQDQHKDKYAKIKMGLVELRKRERPYYVMKFDADDLVSDALVPWVLNDDNGLGYVTDQGYLHTGKMYQSVKSGFHHQCGSTVILHAKPDELPISMDDDRKLDLLALGHTIAESSFAERGTPLPKIPFPAVVYRLGHGQNVTAHFSPTDDANPTAPNWKWYVGNYLRMVENVPAMLRKKQIEKEFMGI